MVLVELDNNGAYQSSLNWGGINKDFGNCITIDLQDNIFYAGQTSNYGSMAEDIYLTKIFLLVEDSKDNGNGDPEEPIADNPLGIIIIICLLIGSVLIGIVLYRVRFSKDSATSLSKKVRKLTKDK